MIAKNIQSCTREKHPKANYIPSIQVRVGVDISRDFVRALPEGNPGLSTVLMDGCSSGLASAL